MPPGERLGHVVIGLTSYMQYTGGSGEMKLEELVYDGHSCIIACPDPP